MTGILSYRQTKQGYKREAFNHHKTNLKLDDEVKRPRGILVIIPLLRNS